MVSVMFSDLRSANFDDLSLSRLEFFGCRLDGTSFRGARLHEVRFIGCFSSDTSLPTDFRGSIWQDSDAYECHLNYLSEGEVPGFCGWSTELVEGANHTLSESIEVRSQAATRLGRVGHPIVAPYLASLLLDESWKVRQATSRALVQLRSGGFPHRDEALLKWLALSLGDKHPKVRHTTRRLINTLQPSLDVLRFVMRRMKGQSSSDKLAGLYAAAELSKLKTDYSCLWDLQTVHKLLSDESPKVREAALTLLKIMDLKSTVPWVQENLSDEQAEVRAQAIRTIGWLAGAASANVIAPLLSDPEESVRIRTLYTLRNIGQLQPNHLAQALTDYSPDVLRVARELLGSSNGSRGGIYGSH
jgi:HEAT repeat protein